MCHVSLVLLTWCGLLPGLVRSQLLDESQTRWSSAGSGTDARHTKIDEHTPSCSISGPPPDVKRLSRVSLPRICSPMPDASCGDLSENELLRDFRGQPAGKEEDSESSDENEPLPVLMSARVVSARQHHRLRILVDHLMRRDGKLAESLLKRVALRALAAQWNHETEKERALHQVEDVEINDARIAYPKLCLSWEFNITMVHSFLLP